MITMKKRESSSPVTYERALEIAGGEYGYPTTPLNDHDEILYVIMEQLEIDSDADVPSNVILRVSVLAYNDPLRFPLTSLERLLARVEIMRDQLKPSDGSDPKVNSNEFLNFSRAAFEFEFAISQTNAIMTSVAPHFASDETAASPVTNDVVDAAVNRMDKDTSASISYEFALRASELIIGHRYRYSLYAINRIHIVLKGEEERLKGGTQVQLDINIGSSLPVVKRAIERVDRNIEIRLILNYGVYGSSPVRTSGPNLPSVLKDAVDQRLSRMGEDDELTLRTEDREISFRGSNSGEFIVGSFLDVAGLTEQPEWTNYTVREFKSDPTADGAEHHIIAVFASSSPLGGINLNPALMDLQIKRDGNGVPLPFHLQPVEIMDIDGFIPVIINVTPVVNVPLLLGFNMPETDDKSSESSDSNPTSSMELGFVDKYRNKYLREYHNENIGA